MRQNDLLLIADFASRIAQESKAQRLKVGAVALTSDGDIICYGYNGTRRGSNNECEVLVDGELVTKRGVIHAEENLIAHAARRGVSLKNGIVVCTHSPCEHCANLLIQCGVKDFYFLEKFRIYDEVIASIGNDLSIKQIVK